MFSINRAKLVIIISALAYTAMLVSNVLANSIPINNITTGAVSDSYFNLFAPIGSTFSIWGLIYFLLGYYQVEQLYNMNNIKNNKSSRKSFVINIAFIITSILNGAWIVAWHYRLILLSLLIIVGMLAGLAYIAILNKQASGLVKLTFGIYFGWITIATVANATIYLVSLGLPNNTVGATIQTALIVLVASLIGSVTTIRTKDLGYGFVILWALFGIYQKHISPFYFDYGYIMVINSVLIGAITILLSLLFSGYLIVKEKKLA
jgi:hypothetical protein